MSIKYPEALSPTDAIKAECDGLPRKDLMYLLDIGNDRIIELNKEVNYLTRRRNYIRSILSKQED